MNDRDTLKLELEQANEKVQEQKALSGRAFSVDNPGWIHHQSFSFYHRRFPPALGYIADLEFNQYEGAYQIIRVSAVRFTDGKEIVTTAHEHTDKPLKALTA